MCKSSITVDNNYQNYQFKSNELISIMVQVIEKNNYVGNQKEHYE